MIVGVLGIILSTENIPMHADKNFVFNVWFVDWNYLK